jgi:hypothetical protein
MLQPMPDTTITWLTATEHIKAARLQASVWRGGIPAERCSICSPRRYLYQRLYKDLLNRLQHPITGASKACAACTGSLCCRKHLQPKPSRRRLLADIRTVLQPTPAARKRCVCHNVCVVATSPDMTTAYSSKQSPELENVEHNKHTSSCH